MLRYAPGPDPYFAYKLHHVDRARTAWVLAEEFGVFEALRQGPSTIPEVSQRTGLQERPVAVLLAASACLGIVGLAQGRHFIHPVMRDMDQALPAGCPVLAQEFLLNADKSGDVLGVYQWFGLLYGTMGDQRTAAEIQDLMAGVGFRELDCRPIDSDQSIVIGWKR